MLLSRPAYRLSVPAGDPPRAACHACAQVLPAGASGWLPGRCGNCRARLGPPAWLMAATAGLVCGLLAAAVRATPAVVALFVAMGVLGVLLAAVDVACKRLPDPIVLPALWTSAVLLVLAAAVTGAWGTALRAGLGALALGGAFLLLAILPGAGLGYGDVKLAVLLGLLLGWLGWPAVILGGLLPWLINGPVVLALLLAGRVGRRSTVPFGPAMLAGALLAVLCVAALAPR